MRNAIDNQIIPYLEELSTDELIANYDDLEELTPALYASRNNKANVIELLYSRGIDLTSYDYQFDTSVRLQAAANNSVDVLKKMHKLSIDIVSNKSSLYNCKVSYIAIVEGALETIKFYFHSLSEDFSKEESIGDFKGQSGVEVADDYNQEEILEFFRSVGYNVNQIIENKILKYSLVTSMNTYDYDKTTSLLMEGFTILDNCFCFITEKFKKAKKVNPRKKFTRKLYDFCMEKISTEKSYSYFNHLMESNKFKVNINDITGKINEFLHDPNFYTYEKNLLTVIDKITQYAEYEY